MLNCHIGLPQHQPPLSKAQIPVYFQKIVDVKTTGCNTYSATRLCPDKWAFFSFKQQHHYFFSSIFADGKRTVRLFYFKPQRALSMRRKIERRVDKDIPSKTLPFSASFAGALRKRTAKHIPYSQDSSINFVPHNYTLCIINYPLFSAFYRRSRPAVWFDSG